MKKVTPEEKERRKRIEAATPPGRVPVYIGNVYVGSVPKDHPMAQRKGGTQ